MLFDSGMTKTSFHAPNYDFKKAENNSIASEIGILRKGVIEIISLRKKQDLSKNII